MAKTSRHSSQQIIAFAQQVDPKSAETQLLETDEEIKDAEFIETLFYPYEVLTFNINIDTILSAHDGEIGVGIDLVNGRAILIEDMPESRTINPPTNSVLERDETLDDPESVAYDYLVQVIQQQKRILDVPDITVTDRDEIYRPFHLVRCLADDGDLHYAVDGISSNYHRLYPHGSSN